MKFFLRLAKPEDTRNINRLIFDAAKATCKTRYSKRQIELMNERIFGLLVGDKVIADQTIYVIEDAQKNLLAVGGWSKRDQEGNFLKSEQSAKMRTFFVHPEYQKFGLAKILLMICENAALNAGFNQAHLFATLNARDVYTKVGYREDELRGYGITTAPLEGETIAFYRMTKDNLQVHDVESQLRQMSVSGVDIEILAETTVSVSPHSAYVARQRPKM